jgi:hypothetical protein
LVKEGEGKEQDDGNEQEGETEPGSHEQIRKAQPIG